MKKVFLFVGTALILSTIFALSGAKAATYQSYAGFSLPSFQSSVDAGTVSKPDDTYHVMGILSTKDTRDINIKLYGKGILGSNDIGYSKWVVLEVLNNSSNTRYSHVIPFSTQDSANAYGMFAGTVSGQLKARNTYLDSTYFNGTWYSSEIVYNNMNPNQRI